MTIELPHVEQAEKPNESSPVRILTAEEIEQVKGDFTSVGAEIPDPSTSIFVGYVEDGKILGYCVLQLKLHAQPWKIESGHSHIFPALVKGVESIIVERVGAAWVYVFSPAGKIAQMCNAMGMQLEPWVVYSKLVHPKVPGRLDFADMGEGEVQDELQTVASGEDSAIESDGG